MSAHSSSSPSPTRLSSSPPSPTPPSPPKHTTRLRDRPRITPAAIEHRVPRFRPPAPTVEDESDALAKEFGSALSLEDDGHVHQRGDPDQYPVLVEVHEHNPERRFVLVPNDTDGPSKPPVSPTKKKRDDASDANTNTTPPRAERPSPSRLHPTSDKLSGDERSPPLQRRRSRQDLPALDTEMRQPPVPEHHRTQSATTGPRPTSFYASGRPPVPIRDDMLSPESVRTSGSRKENVYYSAGPHSSPGRRLGTQRSYSNLNEDRHRDRPQRQESAAPAAGARSESTPDPRKLRRRTSNEFGDASYVDESASVRASRRENPYYKRESTPAAAASSKPMGPRPRMGHEEPVAPPRTTRRRDNSASIHQDGVPSVPAGSVPPPVADWEKGPRTEAPKTRSRRSSLSKTAPPPMSAPPLSAYPRDLPPSRDGLPPGPRSSTTFPIVAAPIVAAAVDEHPAISAPYPTTVPTSRTGRSPVMPTQSLYSKSSPEMPSRPLPPGDGSPEPAKTAPPASPSKSPGNWPPKFDPERDGTPPDQDVGSYRRFSEGRDTGAAGVLPECQRKEPVVGKMDWLTLPRSDMNICPDCYQSVFGNTEFRTHFQPMLRPADRPIACDFGSSPWYRIAWLLGLKHEHADLRLLQQVDSTTSQLRAQGLECPGPRPTPLHWLTMWDPYTRRPVPNFTVCHACAAMVEVLLPSLEGIFTPLDPPGRPQEPVTSVCSLHFRPQPKRFVLYFDTLETTVDRAARRGQPPDLEALAAKVGRLSASDRCREGKVIADTHWYTMQFLPEFTVCSDCFDAVVRPRLATDTVARNFYKNPQWVASAACQLYSDRMRDVFAKACRRADPKYLQAKVLERQRVEADINEQLAKLDRIRHDDPRADQQFEQLLQDWKKWE